MLVQRGIQVISYCFCEPMKRRIIIIKTKQRKHATISLHALFICLCIGVYAYAILSPINSNRLWAHHAIEMPRHLIAFKFGEWILRN